MTTPAPPAAPATPAAPAEDGPSEEGASRAADEPEVDMEGAERADPDDVAGPADEDSDHD